MLRCLAVWLPSDVMAAPHEQDPAQLRTTQIVLGTVVLVGLAALAVVLIVKSVS